VTRSRLALSLALLLGLLQPLLSSPARALAILASHGHGHEVAVVPDSGHVDLVLSHAGDREPEPHGAERHVHALPASERDHVLHLTGADEGRDSPRRSPDELASCLAHAVSRGPEPRPLATSLPTRLAPASDPALVRSVVLRI